MPGTIVRFPNAKGQMLAGRLDAPANGKPRAYALYAHCFTCGKDVRAAVNICRALAREGIATLRFDFTGLGESEGDFADTTLTTNVSDLQSAAAFMEKNYDAPKILVGHSLGGAAVLEAAHLIQSSVAVATISAPANPEHVAGLLGPARETIELEGEADVTLVGRKFHFKKAFLDDLASHPWRDNLRTLRKALLVFHSPTDKTVDISNAADIFMAALHPKSFVSLNGADHLLTRETDSEYVGLILGAWASKYLGELGMQPLASPAADGEVVAHIGEEHYRSDIYAGPHMLVSDEPRDAGGTDAGTNPYGLLTAALGACTTITLRMYADHKKWPLKGVKIRLTHDKIYAKDCEECETKEGKVDSFERELELEGDLTPEQRQRLLEIADRCPVHNTLSHVSRIVTRLK
ncbi:MAG: alpha/beta fold hydrolase [Gammaproteobacteria bacterium]|jgi:putative redox protein|nr:alpha/beta fold hydrolase [Gammaproteobacteria bacterium]